MLSNNLRVLTFFYFEPGVCPSLELLRKILRGPRTKMFGWRPWSST